SRTLVLDDDANSIALYTATMIKREATLPPHIPYDVQPGIGFTLLSSRYRIRLRSFDSFGTLLRYEDPRRSSTQQPCDDPSGQYDHDGVSPPHSAPNELPHRARANEQHIANNPGRNRSRQPPGEVELVGELIDCKG